MVLQTVAQDYQTVNSARIASFEYWGDHGFVKIDSVAFENDSILIPFRNIQEIDYNCFIPDGAHWIGDKIIIRDDGMNVFINQDSDSIYINTAASLNDSWTAFHRPGELSIISTVISHDTMSFLGLQDSVKTIGFQAYNEIMNPVSHLINGLTIRLSKNHGLVRTLNFSIFPDGKPLQAQQVIERDISGLSDPVAGIQDFYWMDIFDFQPGDEIHVKRVWSQTMPETDIQLLILRYLERTDYPDSIVYYAERIFSRDYNNGGNYTYTFIHDTIPEIIHANPIFDKLPGEVVTDTITNGSDLITYALKMYSGTHLAKIIPEETYWFYNYGDTCWFPIIIDACVSDYAYYKGLGGPYLWCWWHTANYRSLVYYKKGAEEWGTPLVIAGMDEQRISKNVRVYPNPAREFMHVQLSETALPARIEIFNTMGSLMKEFVLTEATTQINLQQLKPGLYFYRIANENGILGAGKLVVE